MSKTEFENTLKLTNFTLLLTGIKLSKKPWNIALDYFINNYLFYYNAVVLHTVIVGEVYWAIDGIKTGKPFVEVSLTSPCITISILATIKSWYLYWNKETLVYILDKLKEIHPTFNDNEEFEETAEIDRKIKMVAINLFKLVSLVQMIVTGVVLMTFCFVPALLMGYKYWQTGEMVVRYPFPVKYNFFNVYNSSWWPLIYIHQVWATFIVTINNFACDTVFCALCVHIDMHFHLLGQRFENILLPSRMDTKRNMAKSVMRHQELIDLVNQTEILFSKSSLFFIITSSFLICLSAFNISVADEISTIMAFISFLVMTLSQISVVCYFADMLMRSSTEISGSLYECPWYEADAVTKRTILLVTMRSQKACRLTAWRFADLNLRAFTTILSRSWSYFALLKTVYK